MADPASERILLLVDDEEAVRTVGERMLKKMGYAVLTAQDGIDALEIYRRKHEEIACVILDLNMPRMNGREAYEEMRQVNSAPPTLFTSGYGEPEMARSFEGTAPVAFIQKPYRMTDLATALQRLLR